MIISIKMGFSIYIYLHIYLHVDMVNPILICWLYGSSWIQPLNAKCHYHPPDLLLQNDRHRSAATSGLVQAMDGIHATQYLYNPHEVVRYVY